MPPPPSYRKDAISTRKPNLANTGWADIFKKTPGDPDDTDEVLANYKGPKVGTRLERSDSKRIKPHIHITNPRMSPSTRRFAPPRSLIAGLHPPRQPRLVRRSLNLHPSRPIPRLARRLAHPPRALILRHRPPEGLAHPRRRSGPQRGHRPGAVQVPRGLRGKEDWA